MGIKRCRKTDRYVVLCIVGFCLLTFVLYQVSVDVSTGVVPTRKEHRHRSSDGLYDLEGDRQDRSEVIHSRRRILKTSYGTVEVRDVILNDTKTPSRVAGAPMPNRNYSVSELVKKMTDVRAKRSDLKPKVETGREKVYSCRTPLCAELPNKDRPYFKYCLMKARMKSESPLSKCHFVNDSLQRYPVALASHPGSDGTYIRGLLQALTGYCTGAIYCSVTLRKNGFPGESIRSGAALVVSTDQTEPRWSNVSYDENAPMYGFKKLQDIPVFGSGVLLVRNPFHALLAEWQLRRSGNTNTDVQWSTFVPAEAEKWQRTVLSWLTENRNHPVLVVKYEQLQTDTARELKRVLEFLKVPYSPSKLSKVEELDYGNQREDFTAGVEMEYSIEQVAFVKKVITETVETLKTNGLDEECDLLEYL